MKFSIVTPTFNAAGCIDGCLQSVASQQYPSFEHLVMDGGSSDGTIGRLRAATEASARLRFFSEPDDGLYEAMNRGLDRFEGDYVIFLGADDRFADEHVLRKVSEGLGGERPDVVYGDVRTVGTGLHEVPDGAVYGGEFDLGRLLNYNICHQAVFYSRRIVQQAGRYDARYRLYADWDYNLRCFSLGRFHHLNVVIADYHTYGRSKTEQDYDFHADFFRLVRRYFGLSPFDRRFRKAAPRLALAAKLLLRNRAFLRGTYYLSASGWHNSAQIFRALTSKLNRPFSRISTR